MTDNTVGAVQHYYHLQLGEIFPKTEIDSFFRLSFEHYLKYSAIDLMLKKSDRLSESELVSFIHVVKRLKLQEPIQYILGQTVFYGHTFNVNKHCLIPRPETEELVDWIAKEYIDNQRVNIVDLCTGSGCIAVALKAILPSAKVTAIDISEDALVLARSNVILNRVEVDVQRKDVLSKDVLDRKYDVIVSNPPYVREKEKLMMDKNVLDFEPHLALFVADDNALLFYDKICTLARLYLTPGGKLFLEINEYLSEAMVALASAHGFNNITLRKDLNGRYRMLSCCI